MKSYFLLPDIKIVDGYNRSLLIDLTRRDFKLVSRNVTEVLGKDSFSENEILEKDLFNELMEDEYIAVNEHNLSSLFGKVEHSYDSPYYFERINIYFDKNINIRLLEYLNLQLININIPHISFLLSDFDTDTIELLINLINKEFKYIHKCKIDFIISSEHKTATFDFFNLIIEVFFIDYNTLDEIKKLDLFPKLIFNSFFFHQTNNYHGYYYKTLFVDFSGNIYFDFYTTKSDLNIFAYNIEGIYNIIDKSTWNATTDKTDVCNICEFRYSCLNNSVPVLKNDAHYFLRDECSYNPFISKWRDDDGYLSLAECGVISNEHEYTIDYAKILEINKKNWGE